MNRNIPNCTKVDRKDGVDQTGPNETKWTKVDQMNWNWQKWTDMLLWCALTEA